MCACVCVCVFVCVCVCVCVCVYVTCVGMCMRGDDGEGEESSEQCTAKQSDILTEWWCTCA